MKLIIQPDERMTPVLENFSKHKSLLKIVVKARDELELTREWIEHHAGIVGLENLLIADNASSLPEVLEIYRSFGPALNWFSFSGHHNLIACASHFPQLYAALAQSCKYVAFLDMDERLVCFSESSWYSNSEVLQRLKGISANLVSAPWLQNIHERKNAFVFNEGRLEWGLLFGKPLLSSQSPHIGTNLFHTVQYPLDSTGFCGLGVLHLSNLSVTQRLRANKNKLIQRGLATPTTSYLEIAAMRTDGDLPQPLVSRRCIEEIRDLIGKSHRNNSATPGSALCKEAITLKPDQGLEFGSPHARKLFVDFLQNERARSLALMPATPMYVS